MYTQLLITSVTSLIALKAVGNNSSGTKETNHPDNSQDDVSLRPDHSLVIVVLYVSLEAFLSIFCASLREVHSAAFA